MPSVRNCGGGGAGRTIARYHFHCWDLFSGAPDGTHKCKITGEILTSKFVCIGQIFLSPITLKWFLQSLSLDDAAVVINSVLHVCQGNNTDITWLSVTTPI